MSIELMEQIEETLEALPSIVKREHSKPFTVKKPAFEVLYAGRELDGNRWRNRWTIVVWGGPDIAPNAQRVLLLATVRVTEALLPLRCLLIGDAIVDVQVPGLSELPFTRATIEVREA